MTIAGNLAEIRARIARAAERAGRDPGGVRLVAVSKTHPAATVREALAAGQVDFGENYVQELREKAAELPEARWHCIGRLQSNKVKYLAPWIALIHTVDSVSLGEEIEKRAAEQTAHPSLEPLKHGSSQTTRCGLFRSL